MSVLMFHSVGNFHSDWSENWLSMSVQHFDQFCEYLFKNNYKTEFLDHWYESQNHNNNLENTVYLTFDDGYLDNWLIALPILKKYNLKATIFINPDFVDTTTTDVRKIETYYLNKSGTTLGFLNWNEIIELENSGLVDIQSHSLTHNYYFHSSNVVDIYNNQEKYHWLAWLKNPNLKHLWLNENQSSYTASGFPIFEYGRSLGLRKYKPDENFIRYAIDLFEKKKYSKIDLINHLNSKINDFNGLMENDKELLERYIEELIESKNIIEQKLNKKIEYLCWPGGGYNNLSIEVSKEAGYKASTLASKNRYIHIDNSKNYKRIKRFGLTSVDYFNGEKRYINDKRWVIKKFLAHRGHFYYKKHFIVKNLIKKITHKLF